MLRLENLEMPETSMKSDGQPLMLSIDDIDEDPDQPRLEFDEESLQELSETIARRGVRQPISVRSHPDRPGHWLLNFGARRLRASKMAGRTDIPAFVDEAADSYDQVIENEQRRALRPLELAMFIERRLAHGETQAEIARTLGKSQPYVAYVSALIDAPPWLMELYREGKCRGIVELYQLRRLHVIAPAHVEGWIAGRSTITRTDVQQLKDEVGREPSESVGSAAPPLTPDLPPPTSISPPVDGAGAAPASVPSARPLTSMASPKSARAIARRALFARKGNDVVELLLDRLPADQETIYVRPTPEADALRVAAASLVLIGFLPVDGA